MRPLYIPISPQYGKAALTRVNRREKIDCRSRLMEEERGEEGGGRPLAGPVAVSGLWFTQHASGGVPYTVYSPLLFTRANRGLVQRAVDYVGHSVTLRTYSTFPCDSAEGQLVETSNRLLFVNSLSHDSGPLVRIF